MLGAARWGAAPASVLSGTQFDLTIDELPVNYTGARRTAIAINVPPDPPQDQLPHQSYEQMVEMMRMDDTERYGRVIVDQLEWQDDAPSRTWLALGIEGLAPQWFDIEATIPRAASARDCPISKVACGCAKKGDANSRRTSACTTCAASARQQTSRATTATPASSRESASGSEPCAWQ